MKPETKDLIRIVIVGIIGLATGISIIGYILLNGETVKNREPLTTEASHD